MSSCDVGEWTSHLYAGERGTVNAVFSDSQLAGTLYTYEVAADHDCGQALGVVDGALVAQTAAFRKRTGLPGLRAPARRTRQPPTQRG